MSFLLDSDVCVAVLNGGDLPLLHRLARHDPGDLLVSAIVRAELFYGAYNSHRVQANLGRLRAFLAPLGQLDFDESAAEEYGQIRSHLRRTGTPIGGHDLFIAAQARAHGHVVVTRNVREFGRVDGLQVERW